MSVRIVIRMLLKLILAIIIGFTLGCSLLYVGQESMIFHPASLPKNFKFNFPARFDEVTWQVEGADLHALHFRVENPRGVILYFHGNAGNLQGWGDVALEFTRRGYDVLMPDYRGFGKSTGKIKNEEMLHRDAAVVYDYLRKFYAENQIVIYGRSIGSGIAVHLAKSAKPRALILESPFVSLRDVAAYHYPFIPGTVIDWILRYPMQNDQWIADVSCPVYLIHGTEDDIIPYSSSERLMKLITTKKELVAIPGGGHNDLDASRLYHEHIDRILK
ncbi:MAG: alpha/beta hydrolase [Deltaproteobacteria bacterium]|nr:alpha/beta hydrolase [Deltaproteobacteria bacterium]